MIHDIVDNPGYVGRRIKLFAGKALFRHFHTELFRNGPSSATGLSTAIANLINLSFKDFMNTAGDPLPADMAVFAEFRNGPAAFLQRFAAKKQTGSLLGKPLQRDDDVFQFLQ